LQRSDGRLAVVAQEFDQFVDDFGFMFLARPSVTITLGGQDFLTCDLTHFGVHGSVTPFLSQRMVSSNHFTPLWVTFFLSQFGNSNNIMLLVAAHNYFRQNHTKCRD
jgi:hypothetical protein